MSDGFRPGIASWEADHRLTVLETELRLHVRLCEQRAAMAQRLLWFVATTMVAAMGILLKMAFHL